MDLKIELLKNSLIRFYLVACVCVCVYVRFDAYGKSESTQAEFEENKSRVEHYKSNNNKSNGKQHLSHTHRIASVDKAAKVRTKNEIAENKNLKGKQNFVVCLMVFVSFELHKKKYRHSPEFTLNKWMNRTSKPSKE